MPPRCKEYFKNIQIVYKKSTGLYTDPITIDEYIHICFHRLINTDASIHTEIQMAIKLYNILLQFPSYITEYIHFRNTSIDYLNQLEKDIQIIFDTISQEEIDSFLDVKHRFIEFNETLK